MTSIAGSAPVSLGAERIRRAEVAGFALADLSFPASLALERHDHDRTTLAFVLSGGFKGWWSGREGWCGAGSLLVEPAGERHANHFGPRARTRVIIAQPDDEVIGPFRSRTRHPPRRPDAIPIAWRLGEELRNPDSVSPLMLEGLALELMGLALRESGATPSGIWADRASAIIEERYAESLSLSIIAGELGIHPAHLARGFRLRRGRSVGTYLREVRVRRAAERLVAGDGSLPEISLAVGFADQSHLTRWFRRQTGVTPAHYRRLARDG